MALFVRFWMVRPARFPTSGLVDSGRGGPARTMQRMGLQMPLFSTPGAGVGPSIYLPYYGNVPGRVGTIEL